MSTNILRGANDFFPLGSTLEETKKPVPYLPFYTILSFSREEERKKWDVEKRRLENEKRQVELERDKLIEEVKSLSIQLQEALGVKIHRTNSPCLSLGSNTSAEYDMLEEIVPYQSIPHGIKMTCAHKTDGVKCGNYAEFVTIDNIKALCTKHKDELLTEGVISMKENIMLTHLVEELNYVPPS